MTPSFPLRIGTRGSLLARAQAQLALHQLQQVFPKDVAIQNAVLVPITTMGDRLKDQPLFESGGKALFVKELEEALQAHKIDVGVHSLKDLPPTLPPGLAIGAFLEREDPRDALLCLKANSLSNLPPGSVIGTCAPRRVAQVLHHWPDLKCLPLRGNVDSRIQKLQEGQIDAIILALAGLRRLNRQQEAVYIFPESQMVPAVGQGTIVLECREDDTRTKTYLFPLNHQETERRSIAERALLAGLGGSCQTPIGGHAIIQEDGYLHLDAFIASPSGTPVYQTSQTGDNPKQLGLSVAETLQTLAGPCIQELLCVF